jgi:antibiotic biosynthesis monooxygenase (ABM) superfamily enzyme
MQRKDALKTDPNPLEIFAEQMARGIASEFSDRPRARRIASTRYRLAVVTWAGAYAVITATLAVLGPTIATWPLPLRTLVLSVLMITALTWLVMPVLTRLFRGWLSAS